MLPRMVLIIFAPQCTYADGNSGAQKGIRGLNHVNGGSLVEREHREIIDSSDPTI